MKNLQQYLSNLVEQGEPSTEGIWYSVPRNILPNGYVEFHFSDDGNLTDVRLTDWHGEEIFASSEVKGE